MNDVFRDLHVECGNLDLFFIWPVVLNAMGAKKNVHIIHRMFDQNIEKIELPFVVANIDLHTLSTTDSELWLDFQGWTIDETRYYYDSFTNKFEEVVMYQQTCC